MAIREFCIPYRLERNPKTVLPEEVFENPQAGSNCELLVHAIVSARGFTLPRLRSSEIYEDSEFTEHVRDVSKTQTGDIIGLRPVGKKGLKGIHIGIIWLDGDGEIHLIHNARHVGQARLEALSEAIKHPGHAEIAWIKRPVRKNSGLLQSEKLRELGFGYLAKTT